jgi:hypothetical protein
LGFVRKDDLDADDEVGAGARVVRRRDAAHAAIDPLRHQLPQICSERIVTYMQRKNRLHHHPQLQRLGPLRITALLTALLIVTGQVPALRSERSRSAPGVEALRFQPPGVGLGIPSTGFRLEGSFLGRGTICMGAGPCFLFQGKGFKGRKKTLTYPFRVRTWRHCSASRRG